MDNYDFIEQLPKMREESLSLDEYKNLQLYGYVKVDEEEDYGGFVDEIIDDLETFYDVSKYPAVLIAVYLLKDYRDNPCHVLSKETLKNLRTWRSKK